MIKPNDIISSLPTFAFDEVDNMFQELKKKGITPIDFGIGDPKDATPEFIRKAAKESMDKNATRGYPIYNGTIEYRTAVSAWNKKRFGVTLDAEKELCAAIGAKEVIFNLPNSFVEPGDYILIPNPGYPPYLKGALFSRGIPYFLELKKENNFLPDLNSIPQNVLNKTKILWLNYPNNPTSAVAPLSFLKEAVEFGRKNNIIVINDECYSELYYDDKDRTHSILEITKQGVLSVNSLSKRSCMTGWRIGWIAGDEKLIDAVKKLKANIDSGIPYFIQDAAITALSDEKHVEEQRQRLKEKRDIMVSAFTKAGLNNCSPAATFYIWQELPKNVLSMDVCKKLLSPENGIVITPGAILAETMNGVNIGQNYIRLALVPSAADCAKAAEKIIKAVL
ncbi:MAG: aminotransferase class I/II-fold pyridoxal phosphate-dependent enzyme [Pseudomonadota bacterium]